MKARSGVFQGVLSMMTRGCRFSDHRFLHHIFVIYVNFLVILVKEATAQSSLCRTSCAGLSIQYPFGIDDGCGSLEYRSLLVCNENNARLELRTPTGRYPVRNISYDNLHIIIEDPSMWSCSAGNKLPNSQTFSLDASTKFSLSNLNNFLYFNCNESSVLVRPQLSYCESQPRRCESLCDSSNYLCQNLPYCSNSLSGVSCCSYYPRTSDSMRLMLGNCESYTSIYWVIRNASDAYTQIPAYGIRLNYEVPITTHCLNCQNDGHGEGICGYDTQIGSFLCLCSDQNVTTYCSDHNHIHHLRRARVVAGTVVGVMVGGTIAAGVIIWYLRKMRPNLNRPLRLGIVNSANGHS